MDLINLGLYYGPTDVFSVLADPTRRQIIGMLASRELSAGTIGAKFDMTPPAVSQHLKVLKQAGFVRVRVDGQRRIYSLDLRGFAEIERWLMDIREFWSGRLDALERALEESPLRRGRKGGHR